MRFLTTFLLSCIGSGAAAQGSDYSSLYLGLQTGAWMPRGSLAIVGRAKPYLGMEIGCMNTNWTYGLNLYALLTNRSAESYTTLHRDTLRTTHYFSQAGYGLLVERSLWRKKQMELAMSSTVGGETVYTVEDSNRDDSVYDGKDLHSL